MPIMHAIPILPCRSLDATLAFYTALGFEPRGRYPDYLILGRDGQEVHFALSQSATYVFDTAANCAGMYLRVDGIDALHAAWRNQPALWRGEARIADTVEDKPWGQREFHILDPDRNLLRIGQSS